MSAEILATLLIWLVAFLFSTTCHEAAHALVAKLGGDATAYEGGQVTLDPIPHIRREPFGMLVVPILSFILQGGGWMIGWASAPYDPFWAARHPRRAALMALAGPGANLLIVLVATLIIQLGFHFGFLGEASRLSLERVVLLPGGEASALTTFLSVLFSLNVLLFAFNLLPVPPLDGNAAVGGLLGDDLGRRWSAFWGQQGIPFIGLIVAWLIFYRFAFDLWRLSLSLLYSDLHWS
ncbi:MAG: site-2 protease family protein [Myxococcales bacterium]|nr:site-2 protease family protein [Myxococcales bacterium]